VTCRRNGAEEDQYRTIIEYKDEVRRDPFSLWSVQALMWMGNHAETVVDRSTKVLVGGCDLSLYPRRRIGGLDEGEAGTGG
jgi:hypothetical protein